MRLNLNKEEAKLIIGNQLKEFAERAALAHKQFIEGKEKDAYSTFPHGSFTGENLEEYIGSSD